MSTYSGSAAGDNLKSKQNIPLTISWCPSSAHIWLQANYTHSEFNLQNPRREYRASSSEAGAVFLVVLSCCDCHGDTKCQKQINVLLSVGWSVSSIYTRLLLNMFVNSPTRPMLLSLEYGQEVRMAHDHIIMVYEHAASWRKFRHSYMRRLLYYLIYRCAFNPRWTPHASQLSLCLLESSVWWETSHVHTVTQSKVTRK